MSDAEKSTIKLAMSYYNEHIYPHLVRTLGDPKPIREIRSRIISLAQGEVLEIGVGPGANFIHYDSKKVTKVFALEPNHGMIRFAEHNLRQTGLRVQFLDLPGERIPLPDRSVDTVVSTFTLCTIPKVVSALQGVGRVLKPGGQFIFFEHGLAPDQHVRRWQSLTEPFYRYAFDGCHISLEIPALIENGGFKIERMDTGYLAPFPKSPSYCFWGVAVPKISA